MPDVSDQQRAALAAGLAAVVRAAMAGRVGPVYTSDAGRGLAERVEEAAHTEAARTADPPLTAGQMLGISAALGGPDAAAALADYLIENGLDWAQAVADKARAEERERCAKVAEGAATRDYVNGVECARVCRSVANEIRTGFQHYYVLPPFTSFIAEYDDIQVIAEYDDTQVTAGTPDAAVSELMRRLNEAGVTPPPAPPPPPS
jgi:hypothetical protein